MLFSVDTIELVPVTALFATGAILSCSTPRDTIKIIDEEPGDDGYPVLMEAVLGVRGSPFWEDFRR